MVRIFLFLNVCMCFFHLTLSYAQLCDDIVTVIILLLHKLVKCRIMNLSLTLCTASCCRWVKRHLRQIKSQVCVRFQWSSSKFNKAHEVERNAKGFWEFRWEL